MIKTIKWVTKYILFSIKLLLDDFLGWPNFSPIKWPYIFDILENNDIEDQSYSFESSPTT